MEDLIEAVAGAAQNLRWLLEKSLMGLSEREVPALAAEISSALVLVGEACSRLLGEESMGAVECVEKAAGTGLMPGDIAGKIASAPRVLAGEELDEASLYYLVEGLEEFAEWLASISLHP